MSPVTTIEHAARTQPVLVGQWLGPRSTCVIISGGHGTRLAPLSHATAKSLVKVGQHTLLEMIVDYWKRHASHFIFVLNHFKQEMGEAIRGLGVSHEIIEEDGPPQGIAYALMQVKDRVPSRFAVVLGDCLCSGSFLFEGHVEMGVGVKQGLPADAIHRSYSVELRNGLIQRVVEKPEVLVNDLCGTGFYFLTPAIFDAIPATPPAPGGQVQITDAIQTLVNQGHKVSPVIINGNYLNLTYPSDLEMARVLFPDADRANGR